MTYLPLRRASSPIKRAASPELASGTDRAVSTQPTVSAEEQVSAKKSRAKSTLIAGGVLALVAFGAAGCGSADKQEKATATASAATADGTAAGAKTVAEGAFSFTVTGSKCGVKSVGPTDLSQSASTGQFCLVDVSVKNVGTQATLLDGGAQRGVDAQGKEYPLADLATVFLNEKSPTLLEEIKPGEEVKGVLPFQVPDATTLAAIVLHGATSTPGVRVTLS